MVSSRVYVGGLGYRTTERDIERFFRDFGRVRDIILKSGFAFVVSLYVIVLKYRIESS